MTVYHLQHVQLRSIGLRIFIGCTDELSCSVHSFLNVLLNLAVSYEYIFAYVS
jgi:hypothetical protein